jgi:hypothetical protein
MPGKCPLNIESDAEKENKASMELPSPDIVVDFIAFVIADCMEIHPNFKKYSI